MYYLFRRLVRPSSSYPDWDRARSLYIILRWISSGLKMLFLNCDMWLSQWTGWLSVTLAQFYECKTKVKSLEDFSCLNSPTCWQICVDIITVGANWAFFSSAINRYRTRLCMLGLISILTLSFFLSFFSPNERIQNRLWRKKMEGTLAERNLCL